jgi:hypothetical protein
LKQIPRAPAVLFFLAVFALSLTAQNGTGTVQGKIVGKDGKPLAAVNVALSRPPAADLKAKTGPSGIYRFPSVFPGDGYAVKAEHADFKTAVRANVVVRAGGRSTVDLVLEAGKPEEQTAVTTAFPTIDRKRMTTGADFGRAELQILPSARDPWVILQLVPAVMLDRDNVGGNESTAPSVFVARGDETNGSGNVWKLDGIDVTDAVDLGKPAVTFDFDAIDMIAVTTGGAADATVPTAGIAVTLLNRRGDNRIGGAARFYLTDNAFQDSNLTSELRSQGVVNTNRIEQIKDYGANAGGPIFKNKLWWWMSYGVQDIYNYTIFNAKDQALLSSINLKLDAQPATGNRFEALYMANSKIRYGVNASMAKPEGDRLSGRFRLGDPVFKIQDEQAFGNGFLLSAKITVVDTGSRSRPALDEALAYPVTVDVGRGVYVPFTSALGRSWDSSAARRKKEGLEFAATLYKDSLLGLAHEFKAGLQFSDNSLVTQTGYFQNFLVQRNYVDPVFDLGEGLVVPPEGWQYVSFGRETRDHLLTDRASAYIQDTITKGRLTLTLGLRYDSQTPSSGGYGLATILPFSEAWRNAFDVALIDALGAILPPLSVQPIDARYRWSTWSPRIGLSWDLKGDGRTVLKLSLAQYGDLMTTGEFTTKPLGLKGSLGFWWDDADSDAHIDAEETFWKYSATHPEFPHQLYPFLDADGYITEETAAALEGGFESDAFLAGNYWDFDWANPGAINYDNLTTFYRSDIDPDAKNVKTSPRTREISLGLERELRPDLTASVTATYRRFDNFDWAKPFYPADIYPSTPDLVIDESQTWYAAAGIVPDTVTIGDVEYDLKDAGGKTWYLPVPSFPGPTPYRMIDKSAATRTYVGLDLAVTKRLSHRWFLNASATFQDQRVHWGTSFIDPTNQWALDGKPYGNVSLYGEGGKAPVQMFSRWLAKLSALYQMPLGITASATLYAREGWKIPNYIALGFADPESWSGLYTTNVVYLQTATKDSLPVFRNLSFRLEKSLALGSGRMVFMADVFNVFNSAIVNRATDAYIGVYYVDTEEGSANPLNRRYSEILNPRVMRLGVRFEF